MPGYTPGEQIADLTKLNTNEGAFPPSPRVRAALAAIADESLRLYPDPTSSGLRAAAAARYGVAPDQVLAGNGSDDCLTILYRGFLDAGERVACPWPTYGLYATLAALQGAELVRLPFVAERAPLRAARRPGAAAREDDHPRQPQQPVGDAGPGRGAARALRRGDRTAIVVVDEAYVDFALGAGIDASMLPYLGQHPNLVVLRTMSKSYSLAGARLGLLFAAAPLVEALTKVKDSYNVNAITQAIGIAALEDRAYHDDCVAPHARPSARGSRRRSATLGLTWPESAANFLLVEIGDARRGDLPGAQAAGPPGPLVVDPRAAHQAPHQRRQARRQRPPDRRAEDGPVDRDALSSALWAAQRSQIFADGPGRLTAMSLSAMTPSMA